MTYNSNLSRRQLLRALAWSGAAVTAGLTAWGIRRKPLPTLRPILFTAPSSYDIADWAPLEDAAKLKVRFSDNGNDVGPVLSRMLSGTMANDYDIQGLQGGAEAELAAAGAILPWDVSQIANWSRVWESVKSIPYTKLNGQQYSIPIALNADSIIYLPDEIRAISQYSSGTINSYAAIFDPRLAGKTSMEDAWINSAIFTAIYLKAQGASIVDPGNLTSSELKEVMTFLIDKKRSGQFYRFWQGWEQGVQMLRSKRVVAMTGWEPIVKALQKEGLNARYAIPKEGYEGWTNTLLLHKGVRGRNSERDAHAFVNWLLDGYYGCALISLRGYVVPTTRNVEFARTSSNFDARSIENDINHVKDKLEKHPVFWQNVRPREYKLYDEWWDRLRNA